MNALKKTIKFRIVALISTLGITYLFTGNAYTSLGLTAVQQSVNTGLYYFMEVKENEMQTQINKWRTG
jgi:uncharacterized membrane protein